MKRAEAQTKIAKKGSLELALNIASDHAEKRPLEAIRDLHEMQDLPKFPEALARARMIAAEARTHRIPRELTARGSDHGTMVLSPDDSTLAIAWHKEKVALMDLDSRTITFLEGPASDERIRHLRYSPNGKMLVVERSGHAGGVRIWKLDGSGESFELSDRQAPEVQFSPDSRWLATRYSSSLRLYDLNSLATAAETARELKHPHTGQMHFSPDSKLLAFIEQDLRLYDIVANESKVILVGGPKRGFPGRRETVSRARFTPDGTKLILVGPEVSIFDLATQKITPLFKPSDTVKSIALSSNSKTLAVGTQDGAIYLYDFPASEHSLNTLSGHAKPIKWVAFVDANRRLVSSGEGGELRLWDIGKPLGRSFYLDQAPETIADSLGRGVPLLFRDESKIVAYDRVGYLRVWDRLRPDVHPLSETAFYSVALFSIGSELVAWSSGGRNYDVHVSTANNDSRLLGNLGDQVAALAISSDDRYAAAGGDVLKLWNLDSGESKTLEGHESTIGFLAFVDDKLVSADDRGQVYSWDLPSGKGTHVADQDGRLTSGANVGIDPKGQWLVASSRRKVLLHNLRDGSKRLLATGERGASGIAVSRKGDVLAMALSNSEVAVFSTLEDGEPTILRSPDETENLLRPDFSPDGVALIVSSGSLGVRLWPDWRNSHESRLLRANDQARAPRFSEDGEFIIAPGGNDGVASIWHVATGQRRDIRGQTSNIRAEFWPGRDRVVISDSRGVVSILLDDMPRDWAGLQAWIQQTMKEKSIPLAPPPISAPGAGDLR
jgi:WD40 repeat protein